MAITELYPWDPAVHITTAEDIAAALEAALETNDEALIADVLADIARSPALKSALVPAQHGSATLSRLLDVARAAGLRLTVTDAKPAMGPPPP